MSEKPPSASPEESENPTPPEEEIASTGKPKSENETPPESSETETSTSDDSAEGVALNNGTTPPDTPDLEGIRAASEISMSGGPQSSRAKWVWINLGIKLFKLGARFFPFLLLLGGMGYSYIYFMGVPAPVQKLKLNPVVQKVAETVGVEMEIPEVDEETGEMIAPQGRLDQMLQQTKDVVAASDARVNMANAIAGDGFDIGAALEDLEEPGAEGGESAEGGSTDPETASEQVPVASEAERLAAYQEAVAAQGTMRTYSSGDSEWAAIAREDVVEEEPAEAEVEEERKVRDLDYSSFIEPSPAFRRWLQGVRIGSVMTGEEPKALINNMTFTPGSTIDYMQGITFEGLAEGDTLLVFKDRSGAILTIAY